MFRVISLKSGQLKSSIALVLIIIITVAVIMPVAGCSTPMLTSVTLSDFSISPLEVNPGEAVTISALVLNSSDASGTYIAQLKINNAVSQIQNINLAVNEKRAVTFTVTNNNPGTYTVDLGGFIGQFTVTEPSASASFVVSNLIIGPSQVNPGEPITISATVLNNGISSGSYTAELKINNVINRTQTISLAAGEQVTVSFTVSIGTTGTYEVNLGGLTGKIMVQAIEWELHAG